MRAHCEILGDVGVRFRNEGGETVVLCAGYGFERGDQVLTTGLENASTRKYFPCLLQPGQSLGTPSQNPAHGELTDQ